MVKFNNNRVRKLFVVGGEYLLYNNLNYYNN